VNSKAYNSLSSEYKAIIDAASAKAGAVMIARYDARNPQAIKELVGSGVQLHSFSREIMDASFKAAQETFEELNQKNPNWKKIYPDYASFRRDGNLWFRFCESGFDQFMQRQKL
jgi:TRAP-type mannitol/chloroaromatic compound transport system substrate-binding protein